MMSEDATIPIESSSKPQLKVKASSAPTIRRTDHRSPKDIFKEYYAKMVKALPMMSDGFLAELYSAKLLDDSLKEEMTSIPTSHTRASAFLDKSIKPFFIIDNSSAFSALLDVMKSSDYIVLNKLGDTISSALNPELSVSQTDFMDTSHSLDYGSNWNVTRDTDSRKMLRDALRGSLCVAYKETRLEETEWPPDQPKSIVSVALVYYKDKQPQQHLIEITKLRKVGSTAVDRATSCGHFPSPKKQRLDYSRVTKDIPSIFAVDPTETNSSPPTRILIEGAPGIGKTILTREIAYCWATQKVLGSIEFVFVLYLRNPYLQKVELTEELIQFYTSPIIASEVNEYLHSCSGSKAAFLIDGFDEFPAYLQENSIIVDIIKRKIFSKAIVVVTSRPTATVSLRNNADKVIEILGFDKEDREKYVLQLLHYSTEKKVEVDEYLRRQPNINAFCYVPLHLAILLYLFKLGCLPETLTEMNESFIIHTVYRELMKRESGSLGVDNVERLSYLPEPVLDPIRKLSQLAFKGLQNNQLVFTLDEIAKVCPESPDITNMPGGINMFGLLQAVRHYPLNGAVGVTASFNFLHYTMQEFLAAFYISFQSKIEQQSLIQKTFWKGKFGFMWMMYVGIVGIKSGSPIENFISKGKRYKSKSKGGLKLLSSIVKDKRKLLHLFQCYAEANSKTYTPEVITSMFRNGEIEFTGIKLLPNHISSLVSFLSHSLIHMKFLKLSNCKLGDIGMGILKQFINDNKELASKLNRVNLTGNNLSPWNVYCTIIEVCSVDDLILVGDHGMNEYLPLIGETLAANSKIHSLTLFGIGKVGLESIKSILSNNLITPRTINLSWLQNFNLQNVLLRTSLPLRKDMALQHGDDVKINIFWNGTLSNPTSDALDMSNQLGGDCKILLFILFGLCNNQEVIKLNISNNHLNFSGYEVAICEFLKGITSLKEIDVSNNDITNEEIERIAEAFLVNTSLCKLDISSNNISDKGAFAICNCLKESTVLEELNLSKTCITGEGAKGFTDMFKVNKTIQKIDVSSNEISYNGAVAISEGLEMNNALKELNMSCNSIDDKMEVHDETLVQFDVSSARLSNIFHVTKLDISNNTISATTICSCVKGNTYLEELNISENKITDEGAINIADAISINTALRMLNISKNCCTNKGLICFLKMDSMLQVIYATHNNITQSGFNEIKECFQTLQLTLRVYISWNKILVVDKSIKFKATNFVLSNRGSGDNNIITEDTWPVTEIPNPYRSEFLGNCLNEDDSLHDLHLCGCGIDSTGAINIAKALQINTTLSKLNISHNFLSDDGTVTIGNCLIYKNNVTELDMSSNQITNKGATRLAEVLKENARLLKLNISKNFVTGDGLIDFLKKLNSNYTLMFFNFTHNNVTQSEYRRIEQYIQQGSQLNEIHASWNEICLTDGKTKLKSTICLFHKQQNASFNSAFCITTKEDIWSLEEMQALYPNIMVEFLSKCLTEDNNLLKLNLSDNKVTDIGAKLIADAIEVNATLQTLDVSCNVLSDEGVATICDCLKNNRTLQKLDLSKNHINKNGADAIATLIGTNTPLKVLDISHMDICDNGVTAISICLGSNSSLQELNISQNDITSAGAKEIAAAIWENATLQKLDVSGNKILDDGAEAIGDCLKHNHCLQELYMSGNNFTIQGVSNIAKGIEVNKSVHTLYLFQDPVDDGLSFNMAILNAIYRKNDVLKQLKLPWVFDKDHDAVINELKKKIRKDRTKRANYIELSVT